MFDFFRRFLCNHQKGLATAAGFSGAVYFCGRYVYERLEEVKVRVIQDRESRENLRKRFDQNQHDCTFTILALLPTLGARILEEMDVEAISFTLQHHSLQSTKNVSGESSSLEASTHSLNHGHASIVESSQVPEPSEDAHSQNSMDDSVASDAGSSAIDIGSKLDESSSSWGEQLVFHSNHEDLSSSAREVNVSDFVMTTSSIAGSDGAESNMRTQSNSSAPGDLQPISRQSKGELWQELKALTFTRTLTILYSITLLSLQTHIQLNLIGRYKYIQSVIELEREATLQQRQASKTFSGAVLWSDGGNDIPGEYNLSPLVQEEINFSEDTERQYLTLSWWLINIGYKNIGERVRSAVEAVLQGVSLKTRLSIDDVSRLLGEVRQRVEFEEGDPGRPVNFLPVLFPLTIADEEHVLIHGGLPPHLISAGPQLRSLLDETKSFIQSSDFDYVLKLSLEKATAVLVDGLKNNVYSDGLDIVSGQEEKVRLASLLPGIARWSHLAVNGLPNELVDSLGNLREMAGFSAIIYSSYNDRFC